MADITGPDPFASLPRRAPERRDPLAEVHLPGIRHSGTLTGRLAPRRPGLDAVSGRFPAGRGGAGRARASDPLDAGSTQEVLGDVELALADTR